jgi:catechol 2,3-dioxygenase-like lactoylglutathione lyase family enzyme
VAHLSPVEVRVARCTDRLDDAVVFYRDELGLTELSSFEDHAGWTGFVLGLPGPSRQLELTHHAAGSPAPAPGPDDLLVLYLPYGRTMRTASERLAARGRPRAEPQNPWWRERRAEAWADPDGWPVVLVPEPYDAAPDFAALTHQTLDAVRRRDMAWLEGRLAPGFTLTTGRPGAEVRSRAEWLAITRSRYELEDWTVEELVADRHADAAIVRSRLNQRGRMDGQSRDQAYRMTDVWVRDATDWRLATRHAQPLSS